MTMQSGDPRSLNSGRHPLASQRWWRIVPVGHGRAILLSMGWNAVEPVKQLTREELARRNGVRLSSGTNLFSDMLTLLDHPADATGVP